MKPIIFGILSVIGFTILSGTIGCSYLGLERKPLSHLYHPADDDVFLGMNMEQVLHTWGSPGSRLVAGSPSLQNEKWVYYDGGSPKWALEPARVIYFEAGRVVGWETASLMY